MSDEAAFSRAIHHGKGDAAPGLVYADWLEEKRGLRRLPELLRSDWKGDALSWIAKSGSMTSMLKGPGAISARRHGWRELSRAMDEAGSSETGRLASIIGERPGGRNHDPDYMQAVLNGPREGILRWLSWNDSNGAYTDRQTAEEGLGPWPHEEARDLMAEHVDGGNPKIDSSKAENHLVHGLHVRMRPTLPFSVTRTVAIHGTAEPEHIPSHYYAEFVGHNGKQVGSTFIDADHAQGIRDEAHVHLDHPSERMSKIKDRLRSALRKPVRLAQMIPGNQATFVAVPSQGQPATSQPAPAAQPVPASPEPKKSPFRAKQGPPLLILPHESSSPERMSRKPVRNHADSWHQPGLIANIAESPHDDAPKLVYSDWLEEYGSDRGLPGHVELAQFVRKNIHNFRGRDFRGGFFNALAAHTDRFLDGHESSMLSHYLASHEKMPTMAHAATMSNDIDFTPSGFAGTPGVSAATGFLVGKGSGWPKFSARVFRREDGQHYIAMGVGGDYGSARKVVRIDPATAHAALNEMQGADMHISPTDRVDSIDHMHRWIYDNHPEVGNEPQRMSRKPVRNHADEDAFKAYIAAHPEDDAPRLVFADWLEERGDSRGERLRLITRTRRLFNDLHPHIPGHWLFMARHYSGTHPAMTGAMMIASRGARQGQHDPWVQGGIDQSDPYTGRGVRSLSYNHGHALGVPVSVHHVEEADGSRSAEAIIGDRGGKAFLRITGEHGDRLAKELEPIQHPHGAEDAGVHFAKTGPVVRGIQYQAGQFPPADATQAHPKPKARGKRRSRLAAALRRGR